MKKIAMEKTFNTFEPRSYLTHYYSTVDHENDELLKFYTRVYAHLPKGGTLLEFSGGPTIYSLITAAKKVDEIHFSDHLDTNLREVKIWKQSHSDSFDWDPFIHHALELELHRKIHKEEIEERKKLIRQKLNTFLYCNAFHKMPIKIHKSKKYDIVNVNFVPESITSSHAKWEEGLTHIVSLLKPGGTFIITALKHASYYELGNKYFPAVDVSEKDMLELLIVNNFNKESIHLKSIKAYPYRGYKGMIFMYAKKNID